MTKEVKQPIVSKLNPSVTCISENRMDAKQPGIDHYWSLHYPVKVVSMAQAIVARTDPTADLRSKRKLQNYMFLKTFGVIPTDADWSKAIGTQNAVADTTPVAIAGIPQTNLETQAQPYIVSVNKVIADGIAAGRTDINGDLVWTYIQQVVPTEIRGIVHKAVAPLHYEKVHAVAPVPQFSL